VKTAATLEAVTSDDRAAALLAVEGEMARIVRAVRVTLLENAVRFSPELQPSGYLVLRQIVANHPTPPGGIIASVGMDKSAVSRQLRILKDLGFVTSEPDPDDRRASLYSPTAETLERMESIRLGIQAAYADSLDDWSENDLTQFVRLLGAFNDRIERR
jgi:DNA-binding MarR family transcriptional regulator